jgi:hypothetical protein
MIEKFKEYFKKMNLNPSCAIGLFQDVEEKLSIKFPDQYKECMLMSNGAEGCIGENSYLAMWPIEMIVQNNQDYEVNEYTPELVYFGSDGGGMAYAFDKRYCSIPTIVEFPFESIDISDAKPCADTFYEFLEFLYNLT